MKIETIDGLSKAQDEILKDVWTLVRRLSESYNHRSEAWADMRRLGEMAQALEALDTARSCLRTAVEEFES
jgi:hypothetical protein